MQDLPQEGDWRQDPDTKILQQYTKGAWYNFKERGHCEHLWQTYETQDVKHKTVEITKNLPHNGTITYPEDLVTNQVTKVYCAKCLKIQDLLPSSNTND